MLFGRGLLGKRPRQHELGLEHGVDLVDEAIKGRRHKSSNRMLDPALHVSHRPLGVAFVPAPIQRLGYEAKLDDEVVVQILGFDLAALFLPEPNERGLVWAHNDPRVGAANEVTAIALAGIGGKVTKGDFSLVIPHGVQDCLIKCR